MTTNFYYLNTVYVATDLTLYGELVDGKYIINVGYII